MSGLSWIFFEITNLVPNVTKNMADLINIKHMYIYSLFSPGDHWSGTNFGTDYMNDQTLSENNTSPVNFPSAGPDIVNDCGQSFQLRK
jgi:hypothetical protein